MSNILLVSEITKEEKIRNLFTIDGKEDIEKGLVKYFGYKEHILNGIDFRSGISDTKLNYRFFLKSKMGDCIDKDLDASEDGEGKFELKRISGTEVYLNPVSNSELEVKSEHIILIEELDLFKFDKEIKDMKCF